MDAMQGKGKEYFGFASNPLQISAPAVWLPYTVIDRLIMELKANSNDSSYKMVNILSVKKFLKKFLTFLGLFVVAERHEKQNADLLPYSRTCQSLFSRVIHVLGLPFL